MPVSPSSTGNRITEAGCLVHARRKFFDLLETTKVPDDIDELRALVLEQRAELALARSGLIEKRYEIEAVKARLAKLLRAAFGQSSKNRIPPGKAA